MRPSPRGAWWRQATASPFPCPGVRAFTRRLRKSPSTCSSRAFLRPFPSPSLRALKNWAPLTSSTPSSAPSPRSPFAMACACSSPCPRAGCAFPLPRCPGARAKPSSAPSSWRYRWTLFPTPGSLATSFRCSRTWPSTTISPCTRLRYPTSCCVWSWSCARAFFAASTPCALSKPLPSTSPKCTSCRTCPTPCAAWARRGTPQWRGTRASTVKSFRRLVHARAALSPSFMGSSLAC